MTFNATGKVGEFRFHTPEFSRGAASALGRCSRRCALSSQAFAFGLCSSTRFGKQSGGSRYCFGCSKTGRLGFFSINNCARPTSFVFQPFLFNSRNFVGNDAHVTFGTLDLMSKSGRRNFSRHCFSLFPAEGFIQNQHGVFEPNETRSRICS